MADETRGILNSLRIGAVAYLNAKPLLYGMEGKVLLEHPSQLAKDFAEGELDVALLPLHSVLDRSDVLIADDISISSSGPVYSVFLAHREELKDISTIHLDPASRTSAHLIQVICREFWKITPEFSTAKPEENAARLLIGDQAIEFRKKMDSGWRILDMGEAWTQFTGLPFVYAVWVIRKELTETHRIAEALRAVKKHGISSLAEIIARLPADQNAFATSYLNGYIHYDLGKAEKQAIRVFADHLLRQSLMQSAVAVQYI